MAAGALHFEAVSTAIESMADESAGSAAASSAATPPASAPPSAGAMSDVDPGTTAAAASASSSSDSAPSAALPPSHVNFWSAQHKLRRAREDNDAMRAALLLESAKLNELQTCFQLANDRLGLPYIPRTSFGSSQDTPSAFRRPDFPRSRHGVDVRVQ